MYRSTLPILVAFVAVGCSGSSSVSDASVAPAGDGGVRGDGCVPRGCSGLDKTCGLIDDGCGGQVPCGECSWSSDPIVNDVEGAAAVILAGAKPIPHVAFSAADALQLAVRGSSGWNVEQVDAVRTDQLAIALGPDGQPYIAYAARTGELKLARRDGDRWQLQTAATSGAPVQGISLAVDAQGTVHLVYLDLLGMQLKHARQSGGSWSVKDVAAATPSRANTSLALDSKGRPHVVFAPDSQTISYARLEGESWKIEALPGGSFSGRGNALLLDAQDRAHIAHYDASSLKYLRRSGERWIRETVTKECDEGTVVLAFDRLGTLYASGSCVRLAERTPAGWLAETDHGGSGAPLALLLDPLRLPHVVTGGDHSPATYVTQTCGGCPEGQECGGGGEPNSCGCRPLTCAAAAVECGELPDGCGGTLACGWCESDFETCGGGGVPFQCGCLAQSCGERGCGELYDGCGTTHQCGDCVVGSCGGGGTDKLCGCPTTTAQGPASGTKGSNEDTVGEEAWQDLGNVRADDGDQVARVRLFSRGELSNQLVVTGLALGLPGNALVNGIEVRVRRGSSGYSDFEDHLVRLVKGGAVIGENHAGSDRWPRELQEATYGGPADLWGHGWTVAELNDPGFGVAIAVRRAIGSGSEEAFVESVSVIAHAAIPGCGSRECGVDPCGGAACGSCAGGETCAADGLCIGPTYKDPTTGLEWQNSGDWYHADALSACASLAVGGYTDWRTPTIDELRTLVNGCPDSAVGGACGVSSSCTVEASCAGPLCAGCPYGAGAGFGGCYLPSKLRGLPCDYPLISSTVAGGAHWSIDFARAAYELVTPAAYNTFVICVR